MIDPAGYDFMIFDCDGVILDSNTLKTDAYERSLAGEPAAAVEKLLEYHRLNGGVSRYRKFRLFYEEISPAADPDAQVEKALVRFSHIVRTGMIECAYIPGVIEYIRAARRAGAALFVASGSDEEELRDVFAVRGIAELFDGIYGSPVTKKEHTQAIVARMKNGARGVFFGDAGSDVEAAEDSGLDFVFVSGASLWRKGSAVMKEKGYPSIDDFRIRGSR